MKTPKNGILVGPAAAGLLGWDGFSENDPEVWLVPHNSGMTRHGVIRSRLWTPSEREINGIAIASDHLVLTHLLERLESLPRWLGDRHPIPPYERIELGFESFLRGGGVVPELQTGRRSETMSMIRTLMVQRGPNEPATESFLETRLIQLVRRNGIHPVFRQVPLMIDGVYRNRLDLVVAFVRTARRPTQFDRRFGIPMEADGREYHEFQFVKDRKRGNNIAAAGAAPLVVTYDMVERSPREVIVPLRRMLNAGP
jgi:hypothetical protein